jgi:diguanylate cyclase (GGDEF)-like protein
MRKSCKMLDLQGFLMILKHKNNIVYTLISLTGIIIYLSPQVSSQDLFSESFLTFLQYFPYMTLMAIGFLGIRLNQTRILLTAIILMLAYYSLGESAILRSIGIGKIRSREIFALAAPMGISFLFLFKEMPLRKIKAWSKVFFGFAPILILMAVFYFSPSIFVKIVDFQVITLKKFYIPQLSFTSVVVMLGIMFFKHDRKVKQFQTAIMFSLIPFYTAIYVGLTPGNSFDQILPNNILCFTAISIILIHSVYKMYWGRVYIDELTEIKNRRAFDEAINALSDEFSIVVMDIDHFKKFNDTYGHHEGDNVLRLVAKTLESVLGDKVYRYGGEEFCAVFETYDSEEAYTKVNKARKKLEKTPFHIRTGQKKRDVKNRGKSSSSKKVQVTISSGVCDSTTVGSHPQKVMESADKALYKAKKNGRNRVEIFES